MYIPLCLETEKGCSHKDNTKYIATSEVNPSLTTLPSLTNRHIMREDLTRLFRWENGTSLGACLSTFGEPRV